MRISVSPVPDRRRARIVLSLALSVLLISLAGAQDAAPDEAVLLRYTHIEDTLVHADALVNESVFIDGYHSHDAEISESSLTRVLMAYADGSADLRAEFRTDEWIVGNPGYREWLSNETVDLRRSADGSMTVPESASRPVIRDVPVFPDHPVGPGDRWTAPAQEVHLFRIGGILYGPYRGDLLAAYEYEGDEYRNGARIARIRIDYDMHLPIRTPGEPVRLVGGQSSQLLYWDVDAGMPREKTEEFEFLMLMTDGRTQEFVGNQRVEYHRVGVLDRPAVSRHLREGLADLPGARIEDADDGIRIVLDDTGPVLFGPESAVISPDQRERLRRLSAVLADYGDRDILISGHTADYGSAEGRRRLSLERAAAVARMLFPDGRNGRGKLYVRGMGAEEPAGSDAGNRRVEILILD